MSETSCDIHDVTKAASDLVATGCNIGMTYLPEGITRLRFSSIISSFANEVIQAVDEGLISAWQGLQELRAEHEELLSRARFYLQNGIGVAAGVMQVRTGISAIAMPGGVGAIPGGLLIAHGANNIYEGAGNLYHGPNVPGTLGPVRYVYQRALKDEHLGSTIYYSMDLYLSGYGILRQVPKRGSFELFRYDPITREKSYWQTGKLALALEVVVDFFTLNTMFQDEYRNE
ncbi:DUF4225 domain-containing protein [Pseudomonas sp. ANT_H12B]|uniref:DUF4225 domain-containing protein n=1 Tax=Pseudomonas sp. ANT_H12B TaxID=2597348 RepID=UPI0011EFB025|nr:DUF4225 domain-containing protein [Pseudomonas sp. ANT_H12B]KAA0969279.1 DUF4225 domain-containing protein [Pseudomonas sp. ANT_H12B]